MITAGHFLLASALLHVIGSALTGFSSLGLFLLFPAVLYSAFYFGLRMGLVWVAWLALVCMLGGMGGTVLELVNQSPIPTWILWSILIADLGAAVFLVRALWLRARS
ncbi:hypothetical protein FIU97_02925 [Roseivivax sp. THAF40]|uniref:hypothetical protein n=1 Tax=unclassified Roseivivax TaxID=2639302 RepID=UPI00126813F0|nr:MULTISPECIES: hypothetical protein [unclassified Roseivivax]QFS81719.1 hypothetical protein FIV09_02665 [Roseivivax sp. THAF197b]QFT45519.1 hypothetical protein FIU97_02925 [Roseivivax sp. THAF40]